MSDSISVKCSKCGHWNAVEVYIEYRDQLPREREQWNKVARP